MDTQQLLKSDDRLAVILRGNTWAYNFIAFGLLLDIMYRAMVFHEAAWDLLALVVASGAISLVYAARHNVLTLNRKTVAILGLVALIAAVVSFILATTNAM
jgi:hypothetical protein